jgi:hypothetical protein
MQQALIIMRKDLFLKTITMYLIPSEATLPPNYVLKYSATSLSHTSKIQDLSPLSSFPPITKFKQHASLYRNATSSPDKLANPTTYLAMCIALKSSAPEACLAVVDAEAEAEALDDALEEFPEAADPLALAEEGFAVVDKTDDAAEPVPVETPVALEALEEVAVTLDTTEATEPEAELALLEDEEPW